MGWKASLTFHLILSESTKPLALHLFWCFTPCSRSLDGISMQVIREPTESTIAHKRVPSQVPVKKKKGIRKNSYQNVIGTVDIAIKRFAL